VVRYLVSPGRRIRWNRLQQPRAAAVKWRLRDAAMAW